MRSATELILDIDEDTIVSIHALLAECDRDASFIFFFFLVSIHALLAECDN